MHLKDRSCFSRRRRCLRKQDSQSTGSIRRFSQDGMHKKDTEIRWQSTILARKLFDRIALERHDKKQLHELNGYITPNIGFFVCMLMVKQCLQMQDAHLAKTQQSLRPIRPEHQQRQREDQQFERRQNFDYFVDRKTGWRYYREPLGNPQAASSSSTSQWPTSQWQTSWNSRKSTGELQTGHPLTRHICAIQFERTPRAWLKSSRIAFQLCTPEKNLSSGVVTLPHSLFFPPRHKNTQQNRYNKNNSENTQYITHISKLSRQAAPSRITLA